MYSSLSFACSLLNIVLLADTRWGEKRREEGEEERASRSWLRRPKRVASRQRHVGLHANGISVFVGLWHEPLAQEVGGGNSFDFVSNCHFHLSNKKKYLLPRLPPIAVAIQDYTPGR
ncbi:uncharacterized protein Tco025E_02091 [Trypanosoma conorhini]|uniref:Uncharacterized protein n=1 Tax=Trypanosoma conorhini TaxID=83891 RepID=A0A422Q6X8_9TRYP|nr:uncharacterized protein Tco025E_02091 [Trypanosoma conorhini]RNF25687.1 hypothetical protein Tco025E_02091 [Trypanosoma conorhini]